MSMGCVMNINGNCRSLIALLLSISLVTAGCTQHASTSSFVGMSQQHSAPPAQAHVSDAVDISASSRDGVAQKKNTKRGEYGKSRLAEDKELAKKIEALRADPAAWNAYALRGGFIIPLIAIVAILLGIMASTQPSEGDMMAEIAAQEAQRPISMQAAPETPGLDRVLATPEQNGALANEASYGYYFPLTAGQIIATPGHPGRRPNSP